MVLDSQFSWCDGAMRHLNKFDDSLPPAAIHIFHACGSSHILPSRTLPARAELRPQRAHGACRVRRRFARGLADSDSSTYLSVFTVRATTTGRTQTGVAES